MALSATLQLRQSQSLVMTPQLMQSIMSAGWSVKDVANELRRASKNLVKLNITTRRPLVFDVGCVCGVVCALPA